MNAQRFHIISDLLKKHLQNDLTEEEMVVLKQWQAESEENRNLVLTLDNPQIIAEELRSIYLAEASIYAKVQHQVPELIESSDDATIPSVIIHRVHFLRKWGWAAAVLIVLGTAAYLWKNDQTRTRTASAEARSAKVDIAPGRDRAILTLANGQQVILDSTQGDVIGDGPLRVINLAGKLKYEGLGKGEEYNTLYTPKGGQYQIVLPDGSKVWLNAASSIRFPTAFTGNIRNVEMTGEAYMEIARNPKQPFVITANGTEIRVLGTSFNVNAYSDETSLKTTLLEGSVKVTKADQAVMLKPGQQAVSGDDISVKSNIDIEQALAWKNGQFNFNGMDIRGVMRQLEKWYDIKVEYQGSTDSAAFKGKIDRNVNLSEVLEMLRVLGEKFRLEGKTLIVGGN